MKALKRKLDIQKPPSGCSPGTSGPCPLERAEKTAVAVPLKSAVIDHLRPLRKFLVGAASEGHLQPNTLLVLNQLFRHEN